MIWRIEYAQLTGDAVASTGSRVSSKAPLILQKCPWLVDALGCWLQTNYGTSRVLKRCC